MSLCLKTVPYKTALITINKEDTARVTRRMEKNSPKFWKK